MIDQPPMPTPSEIHGLAVLANRERSREIVNALARDRRMTVAIVECDSLTRDLPAIVALYVSGSRFEQEFRHYSTALAACKRIAREHKLLKLPRRHAWRSRL